MAKLSPRLTFVAIFATISACRSPGGAAPASNVLDLGNPAATADAAEDTDAPRIYDAVASMLKDKHGAANHKTWEETTGELAGDWLMQSPVGAWEAPSNELPSGSACTSGATCDPDFKLLTCNDSSECGANSCKPVLASVKRPGDVPVKMCVGIGDAIYDQVYSSLIKAKKTIDLVSLSPPDGRYLAAIRNAFVYLDYAGQKPDIRMLYGGESSTNLTLRSPRAYLGDWLEGLREAKPDFALTLSCAWLSHLGSWNHSKIIAVDSAEAIVGSMNFWERVYLQPSPVFDMSFRVTGPAAAAAQRFTDTLWNSKPISIGTIPEGAKPLMIHADESALAAAPATGAAKIIGTGRLGVFGDQSADDTIETLMAAAKKTIRISQQDFYRVASQTDPFGSKALFDAILRGVDVYVIKSSVAEKTGYGMFSPTDTFEYLARSIEKKAAKFQHSRPKGKYYRAVCDHLHFAPLRFSAANPPSGNVRSHTKLIVVDDAAFYLGSQNMYYANLQEYGYVVFDKKLATQLLQEYWSPAWQHSSESMVACSPVD